MGNRTACTRCFTQVVRSSDSPTMGNTESLTAPRAITSVSRSLVEPSACSEAMMEKGKGKCYSWEEQSDQSKSLMGTHAAATSSSTTLSAPREGMVESGKCTSVEQQIEHSKLHWSQVVDYCDSEDEKVAEVDNVQVFKELQSHPRWGPFFTTFNYELGVMGSCGWLEIGEKFAEGGQAEIFHAKVTWHNPVRNELELRRGTHQYVLKVFKKGTFLRHLQKEWPPGLFQQFVKVDEHYKTTTEPLLRYICAIQLALLLENGRFAFLLQREHEDLRRFIDRHMRMNIMQDHGPFSEDVAKMVIYDVAIGMEDLHSYDIVHRDLKASNVLVNDFKDERGFGFYIADYECSIGVIGTGFFRAPEILQACKDKTIKQKPELFTKASDVYSFGMTCYEILTGKLPFEGHPLNDYDLVLNGQRPQLPDYISDWAHGLLSRCWHPNPIVRPSFEDILNVIATDSIEILVDFRKRRELILEGFRSYNYLRV